MQPLRVHLFGGFLLERGSDVLAPIASRAGRSLFAYLIMRRGRPVQRDLIAGTFWPDLPEARARRRLSHTLWQIQDVIGEADPPHLRVTSDTLAFDTSAPFWLDVEEFDRLFDPAGSTDTTPLRTCVELYRGDFLAGYFDPWVGVDQEHYRQRYLVALRRLVDLTKGSGDYEDALGYARRLTHHDPLSEEAHREVMRISFLLGRTTEAIRQYERCRSMLDEELGSPPSEPTEELYRKIQRHRRAGVGPLGGEQRSSILGNRVEAPFVGREDERRDFVDRLERVLAGSGGAVLMEGEPGVGKTRLALEAADDAQWRGFEVAWGGCKHGVERPFGPLVEILRSLPPIRAAQVAEVVEPVWLGDVGRLVPELVDGDPSTARPGSLRPTEEASRMTEAFVNVLGALGRIGPQLVVIDDVHWADADTLAVLTQLGGRLRDSRLMVLLVYRSEEGRGDPEVWDMLRGIDRTAGLGRVAMSPLTVFELGEMVKRVLGIGRIPGGVAAALHRRTGGNALFALETLLALKDDGQFDAGGDPAVALERELGRSELPMAARVRSVVDTRMTLLDPETARVFQLAAVWGDSADLSALTSAIDLRRRTVLDAVDDLLQRGLIQSVEDDRYRVAHDQVRQVVYDNIDPERRRILHRQVAKVLTETARDDSAAIGHHFLQAQDPGPAAAHLLDAGERAASDHAAYATARRHLATALEQADLAGWPPAERVPIALRLEEVLDVLGLREDQAALLDGMDDMCRQVPGAEEVTRRRRGRLLANVGRFSDAEALLSQAAADERGSDPPGLASTLVALGTCIRWSGRPLEAVPILEEAVAVASDDELLAAASSELGSTLVEVQRAEEALGHLAIAAAIHEGRHDLRGEAEVAGIQARAFRLQGRTAEASSRYGHAIAVCREIGYRHGEGVNLVNRANLEQLHGRIADALADYDRAGVIFSELGNLRGEAMVLANAASARHHVIGDDDRAAIDGGRALDLFTQIGDRAGQAQCMEIMAGVASRDGRRAEARSLLEDSLEALAGTGNRDLRAQHLVSLALLAVEDGRADDALTALDGARDVARQAGLADLEVEIESVRCLALLETGAAPEALAVAARAVRSLGPRAERAHLVHHRHALVAERVGARADARSAAIEAHRLLVESLTGLSDEARQRSLSQVPAHRAIIEARHRLSPRTVLVSLPSIDAPTGRALDSDEMIDVEWTLEHPDDARIDDEVERRRVRLVRLATEAAVAGAVPTIDHLAGALDVSGSTVRRDLDALRTAGQDVRTRGRRAS